MVIYFTGNGNSEAVARRIADGLALPLIHLQHDMLLNPAGCELSAPGNTIVWVFPVYSWGVPPVVERFIKNCNIGQAPDTHHHLVLTCGDDAGYTDRQWRELLDSRGWIHRSASTVIMPNTYVLMRGFDTDSESVTSEKLSQAPAMIEAAIERIKADSDDTSVIRGSFPWVKSRIIYPWFVRHAMSPRPFHYTEACTGCGLCARHCPMDNITMNHRGAPQWGDQCALCLRCYHRCPTHAVAYGRATTRKHQYPGPNLLCGE